METARITILMYHYVRDMPRSRYPQIKGLPIGEFRQQVEYVQDHYSVISAEQLIQAVTDGADLPSKAALLTFDDGYLDHFTNVFPLLDAKGLPACFFPPARCVLEREVLDVNKIHHVLASSSSPDEISDRLFELVEAWGGNKLRSRDEYREAVAGSHRFDEPRVILIKRMLQRELPDPLRTRILDHLFETCVDVSEEVLAEELYMDLDQVRCMRRHGMYVGSHGDRHDWMNRLDPKEQQRDIDRSLEFLDQVGTSLDRWIMCYPYGAHDASLRRYLCERGCAVGLKTGAEVADLSRDDPLALPRLDTNDVPVTEDSPSSSSA
ncbi:polysaccharide deacetylase family protein [Salinibacter ruber]|uniref:polysaccharide deacetylase family protein n=1 Tax=Salinibacter ruber TaxID=146919 RepID=UPI000E58A893|nr:polysaccharide deacetylase family protein [Salinibacter ruber]